MAGKRYLNNAEKSAVVTLGAFVAFMAEQAANWEKLGRSKAIVKAARTARTWADKTLQAVLAELDPDERAKAIREVGKRKVAAFYTHDAVSEFNRFKAMDAVTPLDTQDFLDICEQAIGVCQRCDKTGEAADGCKLKKLFIKYDVEPLDLDAPVGKCPYQYL
jgi:hypothetical protein